MNQSSNREDWNASPLPNVKEQELIKKKNKMEGRGVDCQYFAPDLQGKENYFRLCKTRAL